MEFNSDWLTLGSHRVGLRSTRGFPTETMPSVEEVVRFTIDNSMSARAAGRDRLPAEADLRYRRRHELAGKYRFVHSN
ncbi:hypothetical protein [Paraburkholderia xenovorans]